MDVILYPALETETLNKRFGFLLSGSRFITCGGLGDRKWLLLLLLLLLLWIKSVICRWGLHCEMSGEGDASQ